MPNHIKQHIPNFFSGYDPEEADFETLEDLMNVPFVAGWSEDPNFHQYSQESKTMGSYLMAETHGGSKWWVIGYLDQAVPGLPTWVYPGKPEHPPVTPKSEREMAHEEALAKASFKAAQDDFIRAYLKENPSAAAVLGWTISEERTSE